MTPTSVALLAAKTRQRKNHWMNSKSRKLTQVGRLWSKLEFIHPLDEFQKSVEDSQDWGASSRQCLLGAHAT